MHGVDEYILEMWGSFRIPSISNIGSMLDHPGTSTLEPGDRKSCIAGLRKP